MQATQNISYVLPVALTIMVSKITGDLLSDGIYDLHSKIKQYPVRGRPCRPTPSCNHMPPYAVPCSDRAMHQLT